jgi:thioredoxin 1
MLALVSYCSNSQNTKKDLSANEFASKIKESPTAPILDVRTPGEFSQGHIANANNIDWHGENFNDQIAKLDKSKPVFVYCLSGARSSDAAIHMRSLGFKEVYHLHGGLLKWRRANLPEVITNESKYGMSRKDFNNLIVGDKIVLVDFYADWCGPCKKMEPYLNEISRDMADKVLVIRINTDKNPALVREFKIDSIPVLQVYKNKTLTWQYVGYVGKETVVRQLK